MKPKVLIVDDTPQNIDLLRQILTGLDCKILVANSGEVALNVIEKNQPDQVLLDVMMPGINGYDTCRKLRANPATEELPVIFVTARQDDVSEGFAAGGHDYITKPINPEEVLARVNHQLEKIALISDLKDLNEQLDEKVRQRTAQLAVANRQLREEVNERRFMQDRLRYLADHDFVTRAHNRNALDSYVTGVIEDVQRIDVGAAYLQIDIDHFRIVNETCGCIAGDELLREVSDLVGNTTSKGDFLARLGGDKFAVVARGLTLDEAKILAERIREQIAAHVFNWEERNFDLSATVALVMIDDRVASFEQLLLMGDEVVYLAKSSETNSIHCYDQATQEQTSHRSSINWALVLLDALNNDHFLVYAQIIQPLIPREDGRLKFECLTRLQGQNGEIIFPDSFLAPAERFQLISKIDRWVIASVCQFYAQNSHLHDKLDKIAINLSAITIRKADLLQYIKTQLQEYSVPADVLCFEITETQSIINIAATRSFMEEIKALGCSFALDDFGSGYASFNYLRELPFDVVKIDGVFIRGLIDSETNRSMVRSVVDIAQKLNLEIVAEFVETQEEANLLAEMGVHWGQGYNFHKPEALNSLLIEKMAANIRQ